jgi:hypothetical protein
MAADRSALEQARLVVEQAPQASQAPQARAQPAPLLLAPEPRPAFRRRLR